MSNLIVCQISAKMMSGNRITIWFISYADINECLRNPCDRNARCVNNVGSFTCSCNRGYSGDGKTCNGKKHAD